LRRVDVVLGRLIPSCGGGGFSGRGKLCFVRRCMLCSSLRSGGQTRLSYSERMRLLLHQRLADAQLALDLLPHCLQRGGRLLRSFQRAR